MLDGDGACVGISAHPENMSNESGSSDKAFSPAWAWLMNVGVSPFWNDSINLDKISHDRFNMQMADLHTDHSSSECPWVAPPR